MILQFPARKCTAPRMQKGMLSVVPFFIAFFVFNISFNVFEVFICRFFVFICFYDIFATVKLCFDMGCQYALHCRSKRICDNIENTLQL